MNGTATASPSTIYVDAEGGEDYTTIQGAINSAYPGDTIIVYPGIYTESVNVYKANLQILSYSGNPEDTVVENLGSGYNFAISANNVTISGFNITGTNSTGIYMSGISGANITNNKLSEVDRGVYLDSSSNCTLDDNTVSNTYDYGIFLDESVSCTLTDNEVSNVDGNGIYLWYSSDCTLTGNIVSDAYDGIYLDSSSNCTLDDNTVSNTYDYGIFLDESVSCTLIDNEVSNIDGDGIYLYYSGSCTLTGNIISDAYDGIYLDSSDNCTLTGNIISDAYDGIYLDLSDSCTLAYNTVSSTYDEGFFLGNSDNCSLTSNTVSNANYGIDLYDSRECILRNNTVSSGIYGISLCEVQNCTFTDNNMSGNWYNFNYDIYDFYDFDNVSGNVIDTSNLVDGKVVYFLENEPDPSIGINAGVIYCINCGEVEIKDFVLQNNSYAIFLYNTSSKMQNNTINNTEFGISVFSSQDVELSDSRVNNSWAGIVFEEDLNINLTGNTVRNSTYGIVTYYSENCTLTGNSVLDSMDYYGFIASGNSKLVKSEESTPVHENTFINSNLIQAVMPRSYGIYSVYCQNLRIENNLIDQIAYRGVYLEDCQNARLVSNSVRNIESVGIYLVSSSGVDLLGNTVHNVTGTLLVYDAGVKESMVSTPVNSSLVQVSNRFSGVGILSEYSQDLRLENNDVSQMDVGILLGVCQNIELVSNSVSDAEYMGICAVESSGVDILDNVVHNVTGGYILPAAGYLPLVSSPLVSDSVDLLGYGICLGYLEDLRLEGNTVKDSYQVWGVYLYEPVNATLESNVLQNCKGGLVTVLSENLSVSDCSVINCTSGGVLVINPEEGTGNGYTVSSCTVDGSDIGLLVTGEGTLRGNTLSGNSYGLVLYDVNNSLIYGNTMTENSLAGLAIDLEDSEFMSHIGLVRSMESPESGNNTIYNNYFKNINNTLINSEANNTWNISKTSGESIVGGPYLGGNYWANPNGTGFSQNCIDADKDGIADSSYEIVNGTFDYLPLKIIPTPHKSSANYIPSSGNSGVTGVDSAQKRVAAGTPTSFNFNNPVSGILGLSFTSQQYSGNVIVRIEVLGEGASGEAPDGEVYRLMNILVGNERFESGNNVNGASINFRISKSWIEENNIDVSTIAMNRFHDEEWNELPTEMTGEDEEYYYFTAETPGFSRYAITGDKLGTQTITPAEEEENGTITGDKQTNEDKSTPGFESAFAVLGILASVFFAKKSIRK